MKTCDILDLNIGKVKRNDKWFRFDLTCSK